MKKWLALGIVLITAAAVLFALIWQTKSPSAVEPNPAIGLITEVSNEKISLRMDDGQELAFVNRQDIPVDHLQEHKSKKEAVSITWHKEGANKIATRIDDAL